MEFDKNDSNKITSSSKSFETVLHRAIRCKYTKVVKFLVSNGANVNIPYIDISSKKKDIVVMSEAEKQNYMQDVEFFQKKMKTLMEQYTKLKAESEGQEMSD